MPSSRRWEAVTTGVLTAVCAAAAGVLVAMWNVIGLAVVVGSLAFAVAARLDPKRLAVLGVIAVLFSRSINVATAWQLTTYIDEVVIAYLFVLLVGRRLLSGRAPRWPPGIGMFAVFGGLGAVSSIVAAVPLSIVASGAVLVIKGILLYFAVSQVDWTVDDIGWLGRTAAWVLGFALVCAAANLAVPAQWASVMANTGRPQYRTFLPSLTGPFPHPLEFGNFMALGAIACGSLLLYRARVKGGRTLFVASVLAATLSFRRTAIVGLLASLSFLTLRRRHAGVLVTALLVVPIAGIVLFPVIQQVAFSTYESYVVDSADNARTRLTVDSMALALQHFPFGVGFGRFGSATAAENYSIEYVRLGYDAVYGLGSPGNRNNHGRFLNDTQWPAILGEAGLIGAVFFVLGLWRIFATFRRASKVTGLPLRLLGVTGLGWSVHVLLESFAFPVFIISPTSPLFFGLAAVTFVILSASQAEPAEPPGLAPVGPGGKLRPPTAFSARGADAAPSSASDAGAGQGARP